MCAVSVIYDYGRKLPQQWTPFVLDEFQHFLAAAKRFDDVTVQPDCHDPSKAEWLAEVERQMRDAQA